jgi:hypothetical protein
MTPLAFEQKYHRLRVSYMGQRGLAQSKIVDVHIYRQTSASASLPEKDALVAAVDRELREAGGLRLIDVERGHRMMIARAFYGKGSPEDCAVALRHAIRYERTSPERLQDYCDRVARIGLDCSGFVNNYFRAIRRITQDRNIADYARGTARDSLADIQPRDVLVWTNTQGQVLAHPHAHIAVVESAPDASGHAVVVESASSLGGLTHSTYTITRVGSRVFRVQRPSGNSHVRICSVN